MKSSSVAHANQGLIKYWGKSDERLRIPSNNSISVCLEALSTHTTVEFAQKYDSDSFVLNDQLSRDERVLGHIERIRRMAKSSLHARVVSRNGFPPSSGFASSASGFAALTVAASTALELSLSQKDLSRLARQGSGSASRSIPGGFAELIAGRDEEGTFAEGLAGPDDIDFRTLAVTVGVQAKKVGSSAGMRITSETSPMFGTRLAYLPGALSNMRDAIRRHDTAKVCHLAEADTLNMHACMLTSEPPLIYWASGTLDVIRAVEAARDEGRRVYFSVDAGQNIFINCRTADADWVKSRIEELPSVVSTVLSKPGGPARSVEHHLF